MNVLLNFESEEVPLGRLAIKRGLIYFQYDEQFLDSDIEISPVKLPLQKGLIQNHDRPFDGLFGVFNDSLPDGWGKLLLDRALRARNIPHDSLTA